MSEMEDYGTEMEEEIEEDDTTEIEETEEETKE